MRDNLRLHLSIQTHMRKFLPHVRITRLRNLSLLISGLFLARSVHLTHVSRKWPVPAKLLSLATRLRRFLSNEQVEIDSLYRPVLEMLLTRFQSASAANAPVRLILDITQIGPACRLLTVSLAYKRRALPLVWSVHEGTRGHVTVEAQKALLERLRPLIESETEVWVLGDSGFGQVGLMRYLDGLAWNYVLRLCGHYQIRAAATEGAWCRLCDRALVEGQTCYIGAVELTEKHAFETHVVMHWGKGEDDPWYLASNRPVSYQTLRRYSIRAWTEALYGDLKGHGFDLEATHMRAPERLERLVLGVCWAYVWLIALGSWVVKRGWRHLVDRRDRRDRSYFRIGWDYLEHCLRLGQSIPVRFEPYP